MPYVLNVFYVILLVVCAPWLLYTAIRHGKYREGFGPKFLGRVPVRQGEGWCLWLHAVSVGEVNLLAPLLMRLEREHPEWVCVISSTTRTGYALARKKYAPRTVFYCPLDFSWAVHQAMHRIRPDLLVLAELEVWPNLIRAAKTHGAKVAIINGRLSARSFRGYRRIRPFIAPAMQALDLVAVQTQEYADRFRTLGTREEATHVTGSVKFDGAQTDRGNARTRQLAALWGIADEELVFLAGSTQHPEEALALATFRQLSPRFPRLRLIITPRHQERFEEAAQVLEASGIPWQRRSRLESAGANPAAHVLLVDALGELAAWWGTAHIAFVGGSMGKRGGQNMIEPAAYGAAVSFGPQTQNFRDVVALMLERDAAVVVPDGAALTAFVERCLLEPAYAQQLGERARQLVRQQLGAADKTAYLLTALFA